MEWLTQNAFEILGLAVSVGSAVWGVSKAYYSLDNRINNLEADTQIQEAIKQYEKIFLNIVKKLSEYYSFLKDKIYLQIIGIIQFLLKKKLEQHLQSLKYRCFSGFWMTV